MGYTSVTDNMGLASFV